MNCRFCKTDLKNVFVDLINSPASNSFLSKEELSEPEVFYPLKIYVCDECKLVQIDEYKKSDDIFDSNYAYFSSYSISWLKHAEKYVEKMTDMLSLNKNSLVTEVASNDGYLLQYFKKTGIPCVGVEPTASTAKVAKEKGIDVIEDFFGSSLAKTLEKSDLILGNNVLAHVPDINDFVRGLKIALKDEGTITMEFPHLLNLIKDNQFDTIYHEHFSYLSFYTVQRIFKENGLKLYHVEQLITHGGSLRIYATHLENESIGINTSVETVLQEEEIFGILGSKVYENFQDKANQVKYDFLDFLLKAKQSGKSVVAYGAAAKGNTLLNYCGVKKDLITSVVDKSPYKQGMFLPGSHIPVVKEEQILRNKPDYIIVFPWNIQDEIVEQLSYTRQWGCQFVIVVPEMKVF